MKNLFSEIRIRGKKISNRIVLPPMVCFGWAGDDGFATDKHVQHYKKRAKAGVGLIVLEATCIDKNGRLSDSQLGIWSDEHIKGLLQITKACHEYNSKVLVQIHHAGSKTHSRVNPQSVDPSEWESNGKTARALTIEEIKAIQMDFATAAARAKAAGFDGVELHGAHGYLIGQFASPITNKRTDQYGGSLENRMKFAVEIVELVRKATGEDFIIAYRMGVNEPSLEDGVQIAKILEAAKVDILHVSAGISGDELPKEPESFDYNWIVYGGTEVKKAVGIPVIVVNGIKTPSRANYLIEAGLADFAAIGREQLADGYWAMHALNGEPIDQCLQCKPCAWFSNGDNCPKNK